MPAADEPGKLAQTAKAVAGALVALGGALAMIAADPSTSAVLPQHWPQWLAAAGAALLTFGGVFGVRNARTVKQAQADLNAARTRKRIRRRPARKRRAPLRHPSAEDVDAGRHAAPDGEA